MPDNKKWSKQVTLNWMVTLVVCPNGFPVLDIQANYSQGYVGTSLGGFQALIQTALSGPRLHDVWSVIG